VRPRRFLVDELPPSFGHSGDSACSFFLVPYQYRLHFGHIADNTPLLLRLPAPLSLSFAA
jgi:hypothetical protein